MALLEQVAAEYSHVTDIQFLVPVASLELWLARLTGDLTFLPDDVFRHELGSDWTAAAWYATRYLVAATETAAWAEQAGTRVVAPEQFDDWTTRVESIPAQSHGAAIRATVRAQRLRYEGKYVEQVWIEAVSGWSPRSFEHVAAVLGRTGAAPGRSATMEEPLEPALATAERLGAEPIRAELQRFLES